MRYNIIKSIYSLIIPYVTSKDVLDPRPDSETIIEAVLRQFSDKTKPYRILDIGTGSGCLLASLLLEYPNAQGVGIDKSEKALKVAEQNLKSYSAHLLQADFMQDGWEKNIGKFDIIVSNPPYIAYGDERIDDGAKHDPKMALYAHENGLFAYRMIAKNACAWLQPMGRIYLEIGDGQTNAVCKIFQNAGWKCVDIQSDLAGVERVLVFTI